VYFSKHKTEISFVSYFDNIKTEIRPLLKTVKDYSAACGKNLPEFL